MSPEIVSRGRDSPGQLSAGQSREQSCQYNQNIAEQNQQSAARIDIVLFIDSSDFRQHHSAQRLYTLVRIF